MEPPDPPSPSPRPGTSRSPSPRHSHGTSPSLRRSPGTSPGTSRSPGSNRGPGTSSRSGNSSRPGAAKEQAQPIALAAPASDALEGSEVTDVDPVEAEFAELLEAIDEGRSRKIPLALAAGRVGRVIADRARPSGMAGDQPGCRTRGRCPRWDGRVLPAARVLGPGGEKSLSSPSSLRGRPRQTRRTASTAGPPGAASRGSLRAGVAGPRPCRRPRRPGGAIWP